MNRRPIRVLVGTALLLLGIAVGIGGAVAFAAPGTAPSLAPVGTAFTYQGFVTDNGSPADGLYDFEFCLFDAAVEGSQLGSTLTLGDVPVAEGYLTVTLDFGDHFDGAARWLEIRMRPGASSGGYQGLLPRQPLTPVPYAVSASNLAGIKASDLYTQAEVDALLVEYDNRLDALETLLASVSVENGGYDVIFTDVNVHIRSGSGSTSGAVNGRGNLIIGYNEDAGSNATRTGSHNLVVGPEHSYSSYAGVVAGYANEISGWYATVSGGVNNTASGNYASISGGEANTASGFGTSIGGGSSNLATSYASAVFGGQSNTSSFVYTTVCGGSNNTASGDSASVSGGKDNTASGDSASVSGGVNNTASGESASISGGSSNGASGEATAVSGGFANWAMITNASVSGGSNNSAIGNNASVSGGSYNEASGAYASVCGGESNNATGISSAISGGYLGSVGGTWDWLAGTLFEDD
jgi:hypothetical protein